MKAIKDGKSISGGTESTAQWKPSVMSSRGTASAKGLTVAKVNPLARAGGELARARTIPQPVSGNSQASKSQISVHKAPIKTAGDKQSAVSGGKYPPVPPSSTPKNKV